LPILIKGLKAGMNMAPDFTIAIGGVGLLSSDSPDTPSLGESLLQRCLTGMMFSFPADCFPDSSGVLLSLFQLLPQETSHWIAHTLQLLPPGSVAEQEKERLLRNLHQRVESGEVRKVRGLLQDFTNAYRRRNVAPREGLGRLEGGRFRFSG
ncbi:hypothetical protein KC364_g17110, partial [Hortaea werneckii]